MLLSAANLITAPPADAGPQATGTGCRSVGGGAHVEGRAVRAGVYGGGGGDDRIECSRTGGDEGVAEERRSRRIARPRMWLRAGSRLLTTSPRERAGSASFREVTAVLAGPQPFSYGEKCGPYDEDGARTVNAALAVRQR